MIRVFVADDHAIVRQGLQALLAATGDCRVVGEASDGRAMLQALEHPDWDVLVLDLSLPRVDGTEILHRVKEQHPTMRVIVLSMYAEEQYALRTIEAGASGYISKSHSPAEILEAIREVARGRTFLSPEIALRAATENIDGSLPHTKLSAREFQIFMLILKARTGVEIAAELDLAPTTVSSHIAHIKEKLGVKTVSEITTYAHRAGLVD